MVLALLPIRPEKFCWITLYACLVQSVQVTFDGTEGSWPAIACVSKASKLLCDNVSVDDWMLVKVSVTHRVLVLVLYCLRVNTRPLGSRNQTLTLANKRPGEPSGTLAGRLLSTVPWTGR